MKKLLAYTVLYPFISMNPSKYVQPGVYTSNSEPKRTVKVATVRDTSVSFKVIDGAALPGTKTVVGAQEFWSSYEPEPDLSEFNKFFQAGKHYRTNPIKNVDGHESYHEIRVLKVGKNHLYYKFVYTNGIESIFTQIDPYDEVKQYCNCVNDMEVLTGMALTKMVS